MSRSWSQTDLQVAPQHPVACGRNAWHVHRPGTGSGQTCSWSSTVAAPESNAGSSCIAALMHAMLVSMPLTMHMPAQCMVLKPLQRAQPHFTCRVLTPSGRLLSITFAQPHFRKPFLTAAKYDWRLKLTTVEEGRSFPYFIYALNRGQRLPNEQAVAFGGTRNTPDVAPGSHVHEQMDNEDYLLSMDL